MSEFTEGQKVIVTQDAAPRDDDTGEWTGREVTYVQHDWADTQYPHRVRAGNGYARWVHAVKAKEYEPINAGDRITDSMGRTGVATRVVTHVTLTDAFGDIYTGMLSEFRKADPVPEFFEEGVTYSNPLIESSFTPFLVDTDKRGKMFAVGTDEKGVVGTRYVFNGWEKVE